MQRINVPLRHLSFFQKINYINYQKNAQQFHNFEKKRKSVLIVWVYSSVMQPGNMKGQPETMVKESKQDWACSLRLFLLQASLLRNSELQTSLRDSSPRCPLSKDLLNRLSCVDIRGCLKKQKIYDALFMSTVQLWLVLLTLLCFKLS